MSPFFKPRKNRLGINLKSPLNSLTQDNNTHLIE